MIVEGARRLSIAALALAAAAGAPPGDDGTARTPARGLRIVETPDAAVTFAADSSFGSGELLAACDRSLAWLASEESREWFPGGHGVGRRRVRASVEALHRLLADADSACDLAAALREQFEFHRPDPTDDPTLCTAYFAPDYPARRSPTARFRYPLHRRPPAVPPGNDDEVAWHTRARIESDSLLAGREVAWLDDPLNVYLIHVNGSARLRLGDGTTMNVGHSATNGRPYTSLGRLMIEAGLVEAADMGVRAIGDAFDADPTAVTQLMLRNDRYVFFRELADDAWPRSGLGIPLVAGRSLAVDPEFVPAGGVVLVETTMPGPDGVPRVFVRLMLAQDRGGAIKGPRRCDLFVGVGEAAGAVAGEQRAEGRMHVLLVKDGHS